MLCKKNSIIHRDIKPQNIFVSRNGDYKLGDFGIAKSVERTMGGTKMGTHKYMAPEVYNNQPYGSAADIYSLGLVLHWLLNERRSPFVPLPPEPVSANDEEKSLFRRFSGEPVPAPLHGSGELKRIVLKACAYDVNERYHSADEMLADLEALSSGKAVSAGPSDSSTPAKTPVEADEATVGAWKKPETRNPVVLSEETDEEATVGVWKKPEPEKKTEPKKPTEPPKKKSKAIVWVIAATAVLAVALLMILRIKQNNQYNAAVALMNDGKYNDAISAFEAMDGYKDSREQIKNCRMALDYNVAVELLNEGKIIEAYESLSSLNGYKDRTELTGRLLGQYEVQVELQKMTDAKIGDVVSFGTYEQDNDLENGKEAIEWNVLDREDNKLLVISQYALDCQQYNTSYASVTWEKSSLRAWLKDEFLNEAFSAEE